MKHAAIKRQGQVPAFLIIGLTKRYFVGEMAEACIPFGPASTSN
jgi:hypothetical protein